MSVAASKASVGTDAPRALPMTFDIPDNLNKRCDLPPEAYTMSHKDGGLPTPFAKRPGFNTSGMPINIGVNQFRVNQVANVDVYQFDVSYADTAKVPSLAQFD